MLFRLMQLVEQGVFRAITSDLTFGELLVKPYAEDMALAHTYIDLLSNPSAITLAPVERDIILHAARLRSLKKGLKLPDAIHLATAKKYNCSAIITNDGDIVPRHPMIRVGVSDAEISAFLEGTL